MPTGEGNKIKIKGEIEMAMATKEQEFKALEKIKKIIDGLGEDSYVGTAFEGCFEIAKSNIENDWACSMEQRYLSVDDKLRETLKKLSEETDKNVKLNNKVHELMDKREAWDQTYDKLNYKLADANAELKEAKDEIIRLKAKLFDMMEANA